jgi:putative variant cofactor biosynthesis B12-binding/radical SAM domain protein 1
MPILLVQLPTSHHGAGETVYPLGLSRLSSLVPTHMEKAALDMNLSPDPWPELARILGDLRPETIAFSFRNIDPLAGHAVSYLSSLKTAAALARRILPACRIIAGGPAFSLFGGRLMREVPEIDFGVMGEGEAAFPQILLPNADLSGVSGLIRRDPEEIRVHPPKPGISLDHLPAIDIDSFHPESYAGRNSYVASMGIEGKRGCDLGCAYCVYPVLSGRAVRLRNPESIADEMAFLAHRFGIRLFHFTDPVLNRPVDHFKALIHAIRARSLQVQWTGFFREDCLDDRLLGTAVDAGLVAVYFSGDSLTDHGLKTLGKRLSKSDLLNAAALTARHGVLTMCHFLVNLPGDGPAQEKESWDTIQRILDIHAGPGNLGAVIFNHVRLYPNAPLTTRLFRNGELDPETDLLFPVYYHSSRFSHLLHELDACCHQAEVFARTKPAAVTPTYR